MQTIASMRRRAARVLRAEEGAVTVEWVVLTAAMTGICVAALNAEKATLRDFWFVIGEEVSDTDIVTSGASGALSYDFEDGAALHWSGAAVADIPGFGKALGPIGGSEGLESVTRDFILTNDAVRATIKFDLYSLDSHDGEEAVLYVGGVEVGRIKSWHGKTSFRPATVPGITVTTRSIAYDTDIGGYFDDDPEWGRDAIDEITITVDNPSDIVSFGIGSTADGDTTDESFALDRFSFSTQAVPPPA